MQAAESERVLQGVWQTKVILYTFQLNQLEYLGATVYITGRNKTTLTATATDIGGNIIPVVCDHGDDTAVENLFKKIEVDNNGRLDFLVNNCYAAVTTLLGKENDKKVDRFWEQDPLIWDKVGIFLYIKFP